ncbi:DUF1326 domain-containing protein [Mesorhizobium sp. VK3E]|uniref:DUF1326 domain-containing protein n=1 Tax=Mesorhizobium australafricanum TaxID=3072311 RepID=A0ABU4X631_9HYPH|nr:DUF1326 domain-containing protein [Mesorhizobium sp. VK3E]MDX8443790.1 DUF1326 domain-containing protein [Mesorhizobium sp. VK3E]
MIASARLRRSRADWSGFEKLNTKLSTRLRAFAGNDLPQQASIVSAHSISPDEPDVALAFHIDTGYFGDARLDDLNVAMVARARSDGGRQLDGRCLCRRTGR